MMMEDNIHAFDKKQSFGYRSLDAMTIGDRLKGSAEEFIANKLQASRFALQHIIFPKDKEEYLDLDKNSILMIVAVTHNKDELPLKQTYVDDSNEKKILHNILSKVMDVGDKTIQLTFGRYLEVAYYLLPVHFLNKKCKIAVDWGKNREGFSWSVFPKEVDIDYINEDKDKDKQIGKVQKATLIEILSR